MGGRQAAVSLAKMLKMPVRTAANTRRGKGVARQRMPPRYVPAAEPEEAPVLGETQKGGLRQAQRQWKEAGLLRGRRARPARQRAVVAGLRRLLSTCLPAARPRPAAGR